MTATISKPMMTSAFQQYETLLIQLASAMRAGDKERANAIRREMDVPERELDDAMLDRSDGLSADLYMLDRKEYFERSAPEQATPQHLARDLKQAWENQDWEAILILLRKDALVIAEEHRAYLRAVAYENLGQIRSSLAFIDYAAEQNPEDIVYRYLGLEYLVKLGENEEAARRANIYIAESVTPTGLLIEAAVALIQTARHLPRASQNDRIEAALPPLIKALGSERSADDLPREVIALGYVSLGFCLEVLGDTVQANLAYQLALVVDPANGTAQEALRGRLSNEQGTGKFLDVQVPDEASKAHPVNASFQTLKAQQIWLAAA